MIDGYILNSLADENNSHVLGSVDVKNAQINGKPLGQFAVLTKTAS